MDRSQVSVSCRSDSNKGHYIRSCVPDKGVGILKNPTTSGSLDFYLDFTLSLKGGHTMSDRTTIVSPCVTPYVKSPALQC